MTLSSILNVCPTSNLTILGIPAFITKVASTMQKSGDNCAILNNGTDICITQYGQPWYGDTAYNADSLPYGVPGTELLFNTAGNAYTDFGQASYTLALFPGYSSVITPAAFASVATTVGTVNVGSAVSISLSGSAATNTGSITSGSGSAAANTGSVISGSGSTAQNTASITGTTSISQATGTTNAASSTTATKSAGTKLGKSSLWIVLPFAILCLI